MQAQKALFRMEVKADQQGSFTGLASTFGNIDLGNDRIDRNAFNETLSNWKSRQELPAMLFQHDMSEPIGNFSSMNITDNGLEVSGDLWLGKGITKAEQAQMMLTGNGPKGLSIGFIPTEVENEADNVRLIKNMNLLEVSVVSFPMNPEARITSAKSFFGDDGKLISKRQADDLLRDILGLSKRQAEAFLSKGYAGLVGDPQGSSDLGDPEAKAAQEQETITALDNLNSFLKERHNV